MPHSWPGPDRPGYDIGRAPSDAFLASITRSRGPFGLLHKHGTLRSTPFRTVAARQHSAYLTASAFRSSGFITGTLRVLLPSDRSLSCQIEWFGEASGRRKDTKASWFSASSSEAPWPSSWLSVCSWHSLRRAWEPRGIQKRVTTHGAFQGTPPSAATNANLPCSEVAVRAKGVMN